MKTYPYANNRLREFRKAQGLSQEAAAAQLKMQCENRLSRWEKGSAMPSVENLFRLANLYHVLPHELYPELLDYSLAEESYNTH